MIAPPITRLETGRHRALLQADFPFQNRGENSLSFLVQHYQEASGVIFTATPCMGRAEGALINFDFQAVPRSA